MDFFIRKQLSAALQNKIWVCRATIGYDFNKIGKQLFPKWKAGFFTTVLRHFL